MFRNIFEFFFGEPSKNVSSLRFIEMAGLRFERVYIELTLNKKIIKSIYPQ